MAALVAYCLIVAACFALIYRYPAFAIGPLVGSFAFQQWIMTHHSIFMQYHQLNNYVVGAMLLFAVVLVMLRYGNPLRQYPVAGWLTGLLVLLAFASVLWAETAMFPLSALERHLPRMFVYIFLPSLILAGLYDFRIALWAIVVFGMITVPLVLFGTEFQFRAIAMAPIGPDMPAYDLNTPLAIARVAATVGLVAALVPFGGRAAIWNWTRWVLVALAIILIVRTNTRGELMAMLAMVGMFIPLARNIASPRAILGLGFAGLVIALALMIAFDATFGEGRWSSDAIYNAVVDQRLAPIAMLMEEWATGSPVNWLFGLGYAMSYQLIGHHPHNAPVQILTELGLVGFGVYAALMIITARNVLEGFRATRGNFQERTVIATLTAVWLFYILISFKSGDVFASFFVFLFAILIGWYVVHLRRWQWSLYHVHAMSNQPIGSRRTNPALPSVG